MGEVIKMEWTPEAIQAEVERRHEVARHSALVRRLRDSRGPRPSWWRRLRSHEDHEEHVEENHVIGRRCLDRRAAQGASASERPSSAGGKTSD
jgi:hypothetical protein